MGASWKRIVVPTVLAGALVLSVAVAVVAAAREQPGWQTHPVQALRIARNERKPVWIDFWAVWCKPCRVMDETTYRDPRVERALEGFVALKVDGDADHVFVDRHGVEHYPTTIVLDEGGGEILRLEGFLDADRALATMELVQAGYARYAADVERPDDPDAVEAAAAYLERAGNPARAAELLRRGLRALGDDGSPRAEALRLRWAELRLASGEAGPAARLLARLVDEAADPDLRGRALAALVRAERERGREERAAEALRRLAAEYPDLARGLEGATAR